MWGGFLDQWDTLNQGMRWTSEGCRQGAEDLHLTGTGIVQRRKKSMIWKNLGFLPGISEESRKALVKRMVWSEVGFRSADIEAGLGRLEGRSHFELPWPSKGEILREAPICGKSEERKGSIWKDFTGMLFTERSFKNKMDLRTSGASGRLTFLWTWIIWEQLDNISESILKT